MSDQEARLHESNSIYIANFITEEELDFRKEGYDKPKIIRTRDSTALVGMIVKGKIVDGELYCQNDRLLLEYRKELAKLAKCGLGVAQTMNPWGWQQLRVIFREGEFRNSGVYVRDRD